MINKEIDKMAQGWLLLLSVAVCLASYYFEYVKGLQPCPLCMMQRLCTVLIGLVSLLDVVFSLYRRTKLLWFIQLLWAVLGIYFSSRQLWLQSLPADQAGVCLPGLDMLVRYFTWHDIMKALLLGSGECGQITVTWLGLSMAAWSFGYFMMVLLLTVVVLWRRYE